MTSHTAQEQLLVVFVHGFKGTDETFNTFPERLQHILAETTEDIDVECIVFPQYETKGELDAAVERFVDWLAQLTVEKEVAKGLGGGAGKSKIVLCGHSMGGLLAADSLIALYESRSDKEAPLWPNIIACIAFDTPYYGVHPFVFKHSATKFADHVSTARTIASDFASVFNHFGKKGPESAASFTASSSTTATTRPLLTAPVESTSASAWQKWALPAAYAVGGIAVAGAAAGTAYWRREDLGLGYAWVTDHMRYVGTLWDEKRLVKRVEKVLEIERDMGVIFKTYYTLLPPSLPRHPTARTFVYLPKSAESLANFWPASNHVAQDEIEAHTGIFGATTNDGYYHLGLETAQVIREALTTARVGMDPDPTKNNGAEDSGMEVQKGAQSVAGPNLQELEIAEKEEKTRPELDIEDNPWK
ncbi:hypothetical protein NEOLEDRAFT_1145065 [Neolentinus lepideus HHB14362 ss-1]|uniref:DUF676 domain-containing protein n=1 Tax=Neolentinus lepideus HHB14362 ss-1 TaxID=1314782 RepID=A0A165V7Q2_9AGAM|nr:hypothetical protein NEOLEDRAFT_1145065 [Neolentinus lepideus HHB14362 ss-1]